LNYRAPEVKDTYEGYDPAQADNFSLGATLFAILMNREPFPEGWINDEAVIPPGWEYNELYNECYDDPNFPEIFIWENIDSECGDEDLALFVG